MCGHANPAAAAGHAQPATPVGCAAAPADGEPSGLVGGAQLSRGVYSLLNRVVIVCARSVDDSSPKSVCHAAAACSPCSDVECCSPTCILQVGQDGGEDLLASWPDGVEPFNSVTLAVLQHLDKEGLSPQQALQLSAAAFIPVAHCSRLVAPQQLFLKLAGAALAPFAWEVPGQFVAHAALLKSLGVQDEPRAEDLVRPLLGSFEATPYASNPLPARSRTACSGCCRTDSAVFGHVRPTGSRFALPVSLCACRSTRCGALLGSCLGAA